MGPSLLYGTCSTRSANQIALHIQPPSLIPDAIRFQHVRNLLAPPTVREDLDHPASELSDCSARPRLASVYSRPLPAASIHEFLDGRAVEPGKIYRFNMYIYIYIHTHTPHSFHFGKFEDADGRCTLRCPPPLR